MVNFGSATRLTSGTSTSNSSEVIPTTDDDDGRRPIDDDRPADHGVRTP